MNRVDAVGPLICDIPKMIGDKDCPVIYHDDLVKIVQDVESREPEAEPPERIGDPGVKVVVILRGSVVRDYGRPRTVVIVVYFRIAWIVIRAGAFGGGDLALGVRFDGQA